MNAVASRTSPLSLGHREALSPRSGEDEALLVRGEDAPRFEPVLQESLDGGAHARDALGRLAGDDERLAADASQHGDGLALAGLLHLVALGVESHSSAVLKEFHHYSIFLILQCVFIPNELHQLDYGVAVDACSRNKVENVDIKFDK